MTSAPRELPPRSGGASLPANWNDEFDNEAGPAPVRLIVEEAVRRSLDAVGPRLNALQPAADSPDALALAQWLGPFLRQTIFDAIRLGMSLRGEMNAPAAPDPGPAPVPAGPPPASAAVAAPINLWDHSVVAAPDPGVEPAAEDSPVEFAGGSVAPWLVGGQVTLLASPFEGFADVQRFLDHLSHLPRVHDVKPKRFSSGRLYVTLGTEYPDAAALADALETELALFRPSIRSVQTDLIELIIKAPTE